MVRWVAEKVSMWSKKEIGRGGDGLVRRAVSVFVDRLGGGKSILL